MKPTQTLQIQTPITTSKPRTKIIILDYTVYHRYPPDMKPYEIIVPYSPSVQHEYYIDILSPRTYKAIRSIHAKTFSEIPEAIKTLLKAINDPQVRHQYGITIMKWLRHIDFPTVSRETVMMKIPYTLYEKIRREK